MRSRTLMLKEMAFSNVHILQHILIIQILFCFELALTLRLRLDIPSIARSGSSIWLHCDYDLENDSLYSIKWYKNNVEFYRYMIPVDATPPVPAVPAVPAVAERRFFKQIGIYVDESKSNSTHVFLKNADLNTEGTYMAEVSTTAFKSVKREKDLRIYVLPQQGIEIIGFKSVYKREDDIANLTCVARKSKPILILAWYINGKRVLASNAKINLSQPAFESESDGLVSSSLGITISLLSNDHHLSNGVLALRCKAIITQIYGVNFEELVIEEHGRYAGLQQTEGDYETLGEEYSPPQIHGHSSKYNIGDTVDLNCSTLSASPPPLLEWFINGREALPSQLIIYTTSSMEEQENLVFSSTIYDNFADFDAHKKSSVLGLRFQIAKQHYQTSDGTLRLRCMATHATIIQRYDSEPLVLSSGRQSSSLFSSYASANGMAFGRFVCSAFLYYITVAWINAL